MIFMETLLYHHKVVSLYLLCTVNVCSGKVLENVLVILKRFVDANVVDSAIKGSLINEDNVEVCPETISCSCLDENVCIESCRKYFSPDAWVSVKAVVEVGKSHPI